MTSRSESPYLLNLNELPRRAGEFKDYKLEFAVPEEIGTPLLGIPKGELIRIDLRAEAVSDGVLLTGEVKSRAKGECGRCLDPLDKEIDQRFQELFNYEGRSEDEDDETFALDGDIADLEIPVRDAVVLTMPINPICSQSCLGLCPECGEKLINLPPDHSHPKSDPRWSGLAGWEPK